MWPVLMVSFRVLVLEKSDRQICVKYASLAPIDSFASRTGLVLFLYDAKVSRLNYRNG